MDRVMAWLERHDFDLNTAASTLLVVIAALALVFLINRLFRGWLTRFEPRLPIETVLTVTRATTAAVWIVAATLLLGIWGVSVGGLWALLVSAATVIGVGFLATWTMISNVTASFFISVWRPFRLGDVVELLPDASKGRVVDRNLMFVMLREENGDLLQIPNNLFFQKMFRVSGREDRSLFEALESKDNSSGSTLA